MTLKIVKPISQITDVITRRPAWFMILAGGILALDGVSRLLTIFQTPQLSDLPDPIFGLPFRYPLLAIGMAELTVACLCLLTKKRNLSLGLMAWLIADLLVYRIGLWSAEWHHPYIFVGGLTKMLNISPLMADGILVLISVFLLAGSIMMLRFGEYIRVPLPNHSIGYMKMSCPACGIHIRFAAENLGQTTTCPKCRAAVTLRKPKENVKISCYFCKGHIEFPAHATGEKLKCPHCKMDITLKEPTIT